MCVWLGGWRGGGEEQVNVDCEHFSFGGDRQIYERERIF